MTKPDVLRPQAPMAGGEREQLTNFLDFLRATVVWKSSDLTDEQSRRSLVPSELTTVAGLLGHLRLVEEWWFGNVLDGRPDAWREILREDPDAEFRQAMRTPLAELIAAYETQCAVSREIVAARELTDEVALPNDRHGRQVNVRWVLLHMIEETARHAGHLDLIREMTDGLTGE